MTKNLEGRNENDFITTVMKFRVKNKKFLKAMAAFNDVTMKEQLDKILDEKRVEFENTKPIDSQSKTDK